MDHACHWDEGDPEREEEHTCDTCFLEQRTISPYAMRWRCQGCDFDMCVECAAVCSTAGGWVGDHDDLSDAWRVGIEYEVAPPTGETPAELKKRNDRNRWCEERMMRHFAPDTCL